MKIESPFLQLGYAVIALLASVIALYAATLNAPLVFDDKELPQLAQYATVGSYLDIRWLSYGTLGWTINLFGPEIFWLRLGNVLLHATNVLVLFILLRQLFDVTLKQQDSRNRSGSLTWLPFFGALLFALHPITVYGVAYLIQRSILMATLFTLLMLIAYLQGLLRNSWYWMPLAALFYYAAVYSKEHSITAPAVALALTFLIRKPSRALIKQIFPFYLLCILIALTVIYATNKMGVIGGAYEPNGAEFIKVSAHSEGIADMPNAFLLSILTQSFLFFKYLLLWLLPNPGWMSVDMREPFAVSLNSWPYLCGLLGFIAYLCIAFWLLLKRGRTGLLGFALITPALLFLTELTTVRAQEPFALYRSYLWMPCLLAALPFLVPKPPTVKIFVVLGLFAALLVPLSLNRLHTFSSALLLWDDAEKLVRGKHGRPGMERIYSNRGHELGVAKRYQEAVADFTTAISIYPLYDALYSDRATAHYFLGNYQQALLDYSRAIELNNLNPISYNGRALTYRALGDEISAQADFDKGCALGLCPSD